MYGLKMLQRLCLAAIACVACLALAACGSSDSSGQAGAQPVKKTGTLNGGGKEIVMFTNTKDNPFTAKQVSGAESQAEMLGYKLKPIYLPDQDQTSLDGLVRQFVASGDKPAAFILWPANPKASVNSTRQLARIAPVIQVEELPSDAAKPYVKAYAGVDHRALGNNTGAQMMALRQQLRDKGVKFHSKEGNLLYLSVPPGFAMGDLRFQGFQEATKAESFNVLKNDRGAYYSTQLGYESSSKILPKYKDKVDFIYIDMTAAATGLVKALKENGLTPGKDVWIVAGNCTGGSQALDSGEIYGTQIQSPYAEGRLTVVTAAQYLATGKVDAGSRTLPATPGPPKVAAAAPAQYNFHPLVKVQSGKELKDAKLWGVPGPATCE